MKALKDQGSWDWTQKPLLDQYIFTLIEADEARVEGQDTRADRAHKRAMSAADQLALTPRGRKAAGIVEQNEDAEDPFAALDAEDELEKRRQARSA